MNERCKAPVPRRNRGHVIKPLPQEYSDMQLQFLEFSTRYFVVKKIQNFVQSKYFFPLARKFFCYSGITLTPYKIVHIKFDFLWLLGIIT